MLAEPHNTRPETYQQTPQSYSHDGLTIIYNHGLAMNINLLASQDTCFEFGPSS